MYIPLNCRIDFAKYNVKWNIEFWRKWNAILISSLKHGWPADISVSVRGSQENRSESKKKSNEEAFYPWFVRNCLLGRPKLSMDNWNCLHISVQWTRYTHVLSLDIKLSWGKANLRWLKSKSKKATGKPKHAISRCFVLQERERIIFPSILSKIVVVKLCVTANTLISLRPSHPQFLLCNKILQKNGSCRKS